MDLLSINEDIIYNNVDIDSNNIFDIWNIKNDFICIKIDNYILFNYDTIKILFNINTKIINLEYIMDGEKSSFIDKVNIKIDYINIYFQTKLFNSIIDYLDYINTEIMNLTELLYDENEYESSSYNDDLSDYGSSSSSSNIDKIQLNNVLPYIIKNNSNIILKHINIINNIINDYNNINNEDNIHICKTNNDMFNLNVEFYEFNNNESINNLINQDDIESIKINIKIVVEYLPKIVFLINFNNIIFKKDIFKELYCIDSLHELVKMLYNIIDDNNNINKLDNNTLNNNILLLKQITELELDNNLINTLLINILKDIDREYIDDIEEMSEVIYYLDMIKSTNNDVNMLIHNIKKTEL